MCSRPLGSPTPTSKRSYVHVPGAPHHAVEGGLYTGGYRGGVWLGGYWEGLYRGSTQPLREVPYQRSGPRKPQHGAGVGGYGAGIPLGTVGGTAPGYPPSGPGRSLQALPGTQDPRNAHLRPIRARFQPFYSKVSQNGQVSSKSV